MIVNNKVKRMTRIKVFSRRIFYPVIIFYTTIVVLFYKMVEIKNIILEDKKRQQEKLAQADADYKKLMESVFTRHDYNKLLKEYNELVELINKKGGEAFLNHGILPNNKKPQFSQDEIRTLLQLCHPDKHDGKQSAQDITAKLLSMR